MQKNAQIAKDNKILLSGRYGCIGLVGDLQVR